MHGRILGLLILAVVTLSGCTSFPLPKVTYNSPATVTSTLTGTWTMQYGQDQGMTGTMIMPVGTTFIPMPGGPSPSWLNFNRQDQDIFVFCLQEELGRLGILQLRPMQTTLPASPDMHLNIVFQRTLKDSKNDYLLEVALEIWSAPQQRTLKTYRVTSLEGESGWTRFSGVSAKAGKKMAAQKLMNAMVPDIEAAVRTLTTSAQVPAS